MKNYLFIGGGGFIGSSIINMFHKYESNIEIHILEPEGASLDRVMHNRVHIHYGYISDIYLIEDIIKTENITKVIHLVSTMVPGSNFEDYKNEFEKIIFPTIQLMQICSREKIQLVYFSSGGTVYGDRSTLEPFVEADPKEPISYYGLSKQMIENSILFEHRTSHLDHLVIRPSNAYGPGQNIHGRQGLIAVSIGNILNGTPINIWGDGSAIRDYIYIDDLADAVFQILTSDVNNAIINIGSGKGYSVNKIIEIIKNVVEEPVRVVYTPLRKQDVSNMILNNTLLNNITDIHPTSIKDGIQKFYEYEKSRYDNRL